MARVYRLYRFLGDWLIFGGPIRGFFYLRSERHTGVSRTCVALRSREISENWIQIFQFINIGDTRRLMGKKRGLGGSGFVYYNHRVALTFGALPISVLVMRVRTHASLALTSCMCSYLPVNRSHLFRRTNDGNDGIPTHHLWSRMSVAQRQLLVQHLGRQAMRVTGVSDGQGLRREIQRDTPSLVLRDVGLPGEDGFSLIRFLREACPGTGVIMVSVASDTIDRVAGLEAGADDYIAKPFEPRELLARVKSALKASLFHGDQVSSSGAEGKPWDAGCWTLNGGCCWTPTGLRNDWRQANSIC